MPANGVFTTDNVASSQLYTEIIDSVERGNEQGNPWLKAFAKETWQTTVRVRQRTATAQKLGSDTAVPDRYHLDYREFTLPTPERWGVAAGLTQEAFDRGVSSDEIRESHAECMQEMDRKVVQTLIQTCLTDGGFWATADTVAPPAYKAKTFNAGHDHYLAESVSGVPKFAHFTRLKHTIQEHGYTQNLLCFMNGDAAEAIENKTEWATAQSSAPMPTSLLDTLQRLGVTPAFTVAGMPVICEDWIPQYYLLAISLMEKPLRWRVPEGSKNSNVYVTTIDPNGQYKWIGEYYRYTSAKVVHKGAGAAYYLNSGTWVDADLGA